MRENRPYGSEGGESQTLPDPYHGAVRASGSMDHRVKPGDDIFPIPLLPLWFKAVRAPRSPRGAS